MQIQVFISYSHEDEWLKDELDQHLGALKRTGHIDVWHDRKIVPGQTFKEEIDRNAQSSNIFLFLVSSAFVSSDYCMEIEYKIAKEKHERGEAIVIPVIVRECDWDVYNLRDFQALPTDAEAVTRGAPNREDGQSRDQKWANVVRGIKSALGDLKKKLTPPDLKPEYLAQLFNVDFVRHPLITPFDETEVLVEPEVYYENGKKQLNKLSEIVDEASTHPASVFTGSDRSGKSLLAKLLQARLTEFGQPTVLVKGGRITNADISRIINRQKLDQLSGDFSNSKVSIIIDDFDECTLPDKIKEKIVRELSAKFERTIIFSFSSAPTVLFAADDLPDPAAFVLEPFGDDKVYQLVKRWRTAGSDEPWNVADDIILQSHEKILLLFSQTEVQKYAYNVVSFLELLDSSIGADLAPSSFASCYEALIQQRLMKLGFAPNQHDEMKNFLSLLAYKAFQETWSGRMSKDAFGDCVDIFVSQYFSSASALKRMAIGNFVLKDGSDYRFSEDYLWYFLCARYVGKSLAKNDYRKYHEFITLCAENIFQKKYANLIIYLAYFTDDNLVIKELMQLLDQLFSKAEDWTLSDKSRSLILGLNHSDDLSLETSSDVDGRRIELMRDKVRDVIGDAEEVVAKYALPFLDPQIADSELVDNFSQEKVDSDSYMKSVNALLRTHSVIGQILNSRSGTYGGQLVMDCIVKMVQASGRYASLNHAIATVLMFDPVAAEDSANAVLRVDNMTSDEKKKKVMRIFAFWSVYLSQTGLARYLSQEHSIRALERLVEQHEKDAADDGHIPFNFTSVMLIAKLYHSGELDRAGLGQSLNKYGSDSSLFAVVRAAVYIYSYYMPMSIGDKQWVSEKLNIPLKSIETQKLRAGAVKQLSKQDLLDLEPSNESSGTR